MPITLITGLPGHGKTLYTLSRWKDEAEKASRPVFHNSIKGLNIPNWQEWDVQKWQDLPSGALMIIDECQFSFPQRGRGQPPDWIERLATHRHLGLDFVIITQNPMLIDSFVRRLVDRHFHVVRKFGTHFATIHEFVNGCKENVDKSREGSIRHEWRYPKEVFDWYTSAELHTVKRRVPAKVWILAFMPIIFIACAYWAYTRLNPQAAANRVQSDPNVTRNLITPTAHNNFTDQPSKNNDGPISPAQYLASYTPRINELPHTAPAYDELTKPTIAPYPAACISSKNRCKCYSQQATVLDISIDFCREIVARGFFLAFAKNPDQPIQHDRKDMQQQQPQPYQVMPDQPSSVAPRLLESPPRPPMQAQVLQPLQVEKFAIR